MEWLLFCLLVALVFGPLLFRLRILPKFGWTAVLVLILAAFVSAAQWHKRTFQRAMAREEVSKAIPQEGGPTGYISSDKCQACHPGQYASWHDSFHRTMTQAATPESVKGSFDNVTLELEGNKFHLERRGNEFWVEMVDPDWIHDRTRAERDFLTGVSKTPPPDASNPPRSRKQVGMLTGSHHFQVYWVSSRRYGNVQFAFPFAWLIDDQRWVPRKDTFIRDPHAASPVQIWNLNCIMCHATAGQPRKSPATGLFSSRVGELGIACEACHGPAEEHVRANLDPVRRYGIHRSDKSDTTILNPMKQPAKASTQVCGQCHGMKWNLNPKEWLANGFSYRPGDDLEKGTPLIRPATFASQPWIPDEMKQDQEFLSTIYWPDGIIRVTGREYNGLVESACHSKGELSCLSCHSMHKSSPDDQLASGMHGNQACLQCHGAFREKIKEHTHHAPDSAGSQCYNCHMPHNTYGLLKAVRSHYIESPNLKSTLQAGRPNACNLCHLDQTLAWTSQHLNEWYGQPPAQLNADEQSISAALLWALRGDAAQRSLVAWNMGWASAQQASGRNWLAPFLAQLLDDPYSAVRYIGYRSLRNLPGYEGLEYDYVGGRDGRRAAQTKAIDLWNRASKTKLDRTGPRVLIDPKGSLQQEAIDRLLQQRDNRPVELVE
jgi:predicted CXXCH cytochrome family protein